MVTMAFFLTSYYFSGFLTSFGGLSSLKEALKDVHKAITLATCLQTTKEKRQEKPFVLTIALSGQDSGRAIPICRRRWTRQWPWRCFILVLAKLFWFFFNWNFSRSQNGSNEKILLTNDITAELSHCFASMWLVDALIRQIVVFFLQGNMWNVDLWGKAGSWGVERRGEEAQHMASYSCEVKKQPKSVNSLVWQRGPFSGKKPLGSVLVRKGRTAHHSWITRPSYSCFDTAAQPDLTMDQRNVQLQQEPMSARDKMKPRYIPSVFSSLHIRYFFVLFKAEGRACCCLWVRWRHAAIKYRLTCKQIPN